MSSWKPQSHTNSIVGILNNIVYRTWGRESFISSDLIRKIHRTQCNVFCFSYTFGWKSLMKFIWVNTKSRAKVNLTQSNYFHSSWNNFATKFILIIVITKLQFRYFEVHILLRYLLHFSVTFIKFCNNLL